MTTNNVAVRARRRRPDQRLRHRGVRLSLMGMYASPLLSGVLAVVGLYQVKRRGQNGFGLAIAALAVSAAVTALHVAMWIHCGHPNFELRRRTGDE